MVTLGWNRVGSFNDLFHPVPHYSDPIQNTLLSVVLWPFQAFGAFPLRQDFAPAGIYAIGMAAILVAVLPLVRTGGLDRRWWPWLVALNGMWLGSQFVLQVKTYSMLGPIWQGRYALPRQSSSRSSCSRGPTGRVPVDRPAGWRPPSRR